MTSGSDGTKGRSALEPRTGGLLPVHSGSSYWTEGLCRSLAKIPVGTDSQLDAIFTSMSAASLSHLGIWLSSRPSNLSSSWQTSRWYAAILALWQLDSFMTWLMTSCESPWTSSHRMPNSMAMRKPLTSALYQPHYLKLGSGCELCTSCAPRGGKRITSPSAVPFFISDTSKYIV